MKKLLFTLCFLFISITITIQAQTWSYLGYFGFSGGIGQYVSVAVDSVGTPYVAYSSHSDGYAVAVKKYTDTAWVTVGAKNFSGPNQAAFVRMVIAPDGVTPYVVYTDTDNGGKATVKKFNGTEWITVGNPLISAGYAAATSLAIAPDGTPYISYEDFANNYRITVMKLAGAQWEVVGTPGFSSQSISGTSLAIAKDGTPYVAYGESLSATIALQVKKFNGTEWESVGYTAGYDDIQYPSLAIGHDGSLYLGFEDDNNSAKATVLHYSNSSWQVIGASVSEGRSFYVKVIIAPDGTPFISYTDASTSVATTKKYSNQVWSQTGTSTASPDYYMDFTMAKDGTMFVGFDEFNHADWVSVYKSDGGLTDIILPEQSPMELEVYQQENSGTITVNYQLNRSTKVKLSVYNLQGSLLATLVNWKEETGKNTVLWNSSQVPKGVYLVELQTPAFSQKSKICIR